MWRLWCFHRSSGLIFQVVRDVDIIRADKTNTVKSLRDLLQDAVSAGYGDSGFPILKKESGGLKMIGYIGVNELEHALSELFLHRNLPDRVG